MLDIAKAYYLNFSYHLYHQGNVGLNVGYDILVNTANCNQP
jgi:hypothetical protein